MKNKVLVLNKFKGKSSNSHLQIIKRLMSVKKAGFLGTLDPLAKGVLPIFTDNMTKLIKYLDDGPKVYRLRAILGFKTDTLDITGKVIAYNKLKKINDLSKDVIKKTILTFLGDFEYDAPKYSAKKISGQRYYKLARDNKQFKPIKNRSIIHDIEIIKLNRSSFELFVKCSKGTYIRSLVDSIGSKLNVFATLCDLERLESGPFKIRDSIDIKNFQISEELFFDISNIFTIIFASDECIKGILRSNNYKIVNIGLISDELVDQIRKQELIDNKVVNIIATTKNEIKLLLVSFFKNNGNYHYSKVEILS